ncbi:hypothetical protein ACWD26_14930 [Streptomyces sp. NPDC002787]
MSSRAAVIAMPPEETAGVYEASHVKRVRSTNTQLSALDDAIVQVCQENQPITLRGVYYRVMSAGAVEKTEAAYNKVGRQLKKLREDGRVPYRWIADGTRWLVEPQSYRDAEAALEATAEAYRKMLWLDQPVAVMIFTEKDAITGVVSGETKKYQVPLGILRGYSSLSFAHSTASAIRRYGKPVHVYHLGDHDPSGVDAWRCFREKLTEFAPDANIRFDRLAVTEEQIEELALPTRPTKRSDTRSKKWTGGESVEVDAIEPDTLRRIVREAIEQHIDTHALELTEAAEESERDYLWDLVAEL